MKRFLIIVAVLALLVPGALLAQDGLTLEGLAAEVEGLAAKLTEIFTAQNDIAQRLAAIETTVAPTATATSTRTPTSTRAPTSTPTVQTEAQEEIAHLAFLLTLNDYEGTGGTTRPWGSFSRLSDDEQERRIANYRRPFIAAAEKCGVEYREMFRIVNSSTNWLELDGVAAKLDTPMRAYWLEWILANEITRPCALIVSEAAFSLMEEYAPTPEPVSTLEPTAKFTVLFKNGYVWAFDANFLTEEGDLLLHINGRTYTNFLGRISLTEDEEMGALYGGKHGYDKWEITSNDVTTIYAEVRGERFNCERYGLYAQRCTKAK